MNIYSITEYEKLGFSSKDAEEKVNTNKERTIIGFKLSYAKKLIEKHELDISPKELLQLENEFLTAFNIKLNKLIQLIKDIILYNNSDIKNAIQLLKITCDDLSKIYKRIITTELFYIRLFGENSIKHKEFKERSKTFASCSFEKFSKQYDDIEIAKVEFKKKHGSWDVENIKHRFNCSEIEAKNILSERIQKSKDTFSQKSKEEKIRINQSKANNISNYKKKYGDELGEIKFQEFLERKKGITSKKYYIELYGNEIGLNIFYDKKIKNNFWCIDYWKNKGLTENEAIEKLNNLYKNRPSFSKDFCIKKYGEALGIEIWKNRQILWQQSLNKKPIEELQRINKLKGLTLENYIIKYGNEDGEKKYLEKREKINCGVSKESKIFFLKLYKILRKIGILNKKESYFGVRGSKEYFIYSKKHKRIFFYDFCIKKLKIIIEYHGIIFHPKINDFDWISPISKSNYENARYIDLIKEETAINSNFDYYIIWSDDDLEQKLFDLTNIIFKKYEELTSE
jgi:hypothetical protein